MEPKLYHLQDQIISLRLGSSSISKEPVMYKDLSSIPSIYGKRQARQCDFSNTPHHVATFPPTHNLPVSLRKDIELMGLWFGQSKSKRPCSWYQTA